MYDAAKVRHGTFVLQGLHSVHGVARHAVESLNTIVS